ncbi:ferredoxin [Amycolatopsis acidicola]|uniref:Ferredoxin n=1 Tax=Amycolatopsis acidicola TaxID=2596893 RepID=A0A5N0V0W9_9PSEU|nr:ferredoxin [Amycolatopsis acidicola]KAA9156568.1 ferredoxin [Amycolatopsis acidicola]
MRAQLRIDLGLCQGHGRCYEIAPELIDADDEGLAVLTSDEPVEAGRAKEIAGCCPEFAIEVEEAR